MKQKLSAVLICLLLLLVSLPVLAQTATTGQVIGTVKDPTGAVVPGASITLTSASGEKRSVTSDAEGNFRLALVPTGTYSLTVDAKGFKPVTLKDVGVRVTETTTLAANLALVSTQESVEVTAESTLVQTSNPATGRVVGERQIEQIPLPTRNFQQLLALSPGTVAALSNTTEMGRGDVLIGVNGQRVTSNNVLIDGTEVNSPGTNGTTNISVPNPDTVQEFIVQTSLYDASQGRNAGGNIAIVTKSGTNQFHGSAFEFFRNRVLNANDYFYKRTNPEAPILNRNQFGGTLGGPIIKDKTFFFVSYQGTRERNGASLSNSLTFPNIPSGLTNDRSDAALQSLATAFGVTTLNPVAKSLLQVKLPSGGYAIPSAGGTATAATIPVSTPLSGISTYREDQFSVNIDQQIGQKNRLQGKYFFSDIPQFQTMFTFVGANAYQALGYGGNIDFHNRVLTIADTHVFNSNVINEVRFGYSKIDGPSTPQEPFTGSQFGITNPLCAAGQSNFCGMPTIGVTGLFTIGSTSLADQRSTVETFQISDMLSYTHGRHALKFGGEWRDYHVGFFFNFFSRGQITFNNFKDFLSGTIATSLLGNGIRDRNYRSSDLNFFVQDDYRVTDSLTLNIGARMGYNGGIHDTNGYLVNFDPTQFAANSHACTSANPCTGNNGFQVLPAGTNLNPNDGFFAPRFGFSLKPFQKDNFVLRGGAGVYFDRFSTRVANLQVFNYPTDIVGLLLGAPYGPATFASPFPSSMASLTFPIANNPIPSPVTYNFSIFNVPVPISGVYVDKNFRTPYVYQYNFGYQWEFKRNWLWELGYVGSTGHKLLNVYTWNQGATGTAPYNTALGPLGPLSQGFSTNKLLNGFQVAQSNAGANYNSLQTSLTKRFSHGLQFLASYTYSRSIDYISGNSTAGNEFVAAPGDQQNLASMRGPSDFDRPHRFVISGLYDLPNFYKGGSGFAKSAINGWEATGIFTIQSGAPFSVVCTSGATLYNRGDLVAGQSPYVDGSTENKLNNYFNTAAFAGSCTNTAPYGTSGRNIIRGPHQRDVDLGIIKNFAITERQKLQFRTEFFNAFNYANFANPNNTIVSGVALNLQTTGKITSTSTGPRIIQFALKYSF